MVVLHVLFVIITRKVCRYWKQDIHYVKIIKLKVHFGLYISTTFILDLPIFLYITF